VPITGSNAGEDLGLGLDLNMDFKTDDSFVVH
jgi:hypothetical protein